MTLIQPDEPHPEDGMANEATFELGMALDRLRLAFGPAFGQLADHSTSGSEQLEILDMERALEADHADGQARGLADWDSELERAIAAAAEQDVERMETIRAASRAFSETVTRHRTAQGPDGEASRAELESAWARLSETVERRG